MGRCRKGVKNEQQGLEVSQSFTNIHISSLRRVLRTLIIAFARSCEVKLMIYRVRHKKNPFQTVDNSITDRNISTKLSEHISDIIRQNSAKYFENI